MPAASAQDLEHIQLGVFGDYYHLSQTGTSFGGVGARFGFMAYKELKWEAQVAYDFDQAFTEGFSDGSGTGTVFVDRSGIRLLHGEFGPKVDFGHFPLHPFLTGFINFRINDEPATIGTFFSSVANLRTNNVSATLYPGGGLEGHLGPVGLRLDVGDNIYFADGAHHNLSVSFGPYIRF